ncbi:hypothetical protein [Paracoccus marinaquae]|uniref:Uncharacterized protein n=1 Tax=Paracoccus marinaquae TaxID=2841926 RepID=A0ABS6AQ96_9RHOB|nr:hypothetical protein [Paracoccus marinaquae]MBU3032381.1 hypothetical protein [Paracoccus marinaquae]
MPSRNPLSFDDLLDLFEAYVATIGAPLQKAVHLIQDELDYHQGDIFQNIMTPVCDAEDMAQRLRAIRAVRQARGMVHLVLSPPDVRITAGHVQELQELVYDAAAALSTVHRTVMNDPQYLADDWQMPAGTLETINLTRRVLDDAAERQCAYLRRHAQLLERAAARLDTEEATS